MKPGLVLALTLTIGLSSVFAQSAKKEYEFKGRIEQIDAKAKTMTVNGEKVEGWMAAMTMKYKVDKDDVLGKVKAGDQITAKVYDGDFETLHNVKVVPKDAKAAPSGK